MHSINLYVHSINQVVASRLVRGNHLSNAATQGISPTVGLSKPLSKSKYTLSHTCSLQVHLASDVRIHSPTFSGVHKKFATGPTFPAQKTLRKGLTNHNSSFEGTLIYETIFHYINTDP